MVDAFVSSRPGISEQGDIGVCDMRFARLESPTRASFVL